jgi:predicted ATP-grasp superfamily ATP-dependent carboligase
MRQDGSEVLNKMRKDSNPEPMAVVYPDNLAALGVARALGAVGIPVTVLAPDRSTPGQYSRYARRVPCPPLADEAASIAYLAEFGRTQSQPAVLFLTNDDALVSVLRHRVFLEAWYRFPMASWPIVSPMMLKDHLYRSLEDVVPVPRTLLPRHASDLIRVAHEIGYPALIKPPLRCLSSSLDISPTSFEVIFGAKAIRVGRWEELHNAYRAARAAGFQVVVQEEIMGPISSLYSLSLYASQEGKVVAAFTSQKLGQNPPDFGDGLVVQAVCKPELISLGERVVRHFGYYGMADIEFKWDARTDDYKLLDINPRPWLWINLPTACGVNLPYAAYLDVQQRPLDTSTFAQRDFQTRWVSLRGLCASLIRCLRMGRARRDFMPLLRHWRGRRVGPLLHTQDLLLRMFLHPAFWWSTLRQAAVGMKHLHLQRQ